MASETESRAGDEAASASEGTGDEAFKSVITVPVSLTNRRVTHASTVARGSRVLRTSNTTDRARVLTVNPDPISQAAVAAAADADGCVL